MIRVILPTKQSKNDDTFVFYKSINIKSMSQMGNLETNSIGGFGAYGSSFGGIPPVGLFGITDRDRGHNHGCHKDEHGSLFILNAIGNVKDTVQTAKDSLDERLDSVKDSLTSRVESTKDTVVSEARRIDGELCEVRSDIKDSAYAITIQAERNTSEIKNQAQLNHLDNDRKFDALSREGERNTALILAKLNQTELDNLRDLLHGERRRGDNREIEINIANTNTNVLTAIQSIRTETDRKFDVLFGSFNQLNKSTQDIINFGTMAASGNQAVSTNNVKS